MRAVIVNEYGGTPVVAEIPTPQPAPSQCRNGPDHGRRRNRIAMHVCVTGAAHLSSEHKETPL